MLEEILILRIFPKDQTNFSAYTIHPRSWRGARVLSIPFIKPYLY